MFPTNNDFESEFTFESNATPSSEEPPFHVLLLGNWSGSLNKIDLNRRRPINIDRDNFDEVLKKLNPQLDLELGDDQTSSLHLEFAELDDFHPDNLFRQVSLFSELRDIRRRLSDTESFEKAAYEVRSWFYSTEATPTESELSTEVNDAPLPPSTDNLLDMILTEPRQSVSVKPQTVDNTELGRFVSKIVSPHLIRIDEQEQTKLIAAVDETISELMRAILHHPKFQALESAWRGLYFLVRRVETDSELKIFIFDISKTELTNDLKAVDDLSDSGFYRQLFPETVGNPASDSFAVVGGNYTFGMNVDDVASLIRIGKIFGSAEAPFISHIEPEIFGLDMMTEKIDKSMITDAENSMEGKLWTALRHSPEAEYIALTPMKILARMPYGEAHDSTEAFSFEEFTQTHEHEKFLWMNPCFVSTFLLARSFQLFGWQMGQNLQREIENLPLYIYQEEDETKSKPCAEILLTESLLEKLLDNGLMPLVSFRDNDKVRLWRFQSVSASKKLGGKWNSHS